MCAIVSCFGQLNTGDLAFVQYNADGPEIIKFLALADIAAGESIDITDNGWLNTGSFRGGEGVYTYTVPVGGHSCGDIITIDLSNVALSGAGDQLIVYQGATMITAINSEGAGVWQANATNANTSALPTGLTNGTNAVALNEIDNAKYVGTLTGTIADLRTAIHNNSNWSGDNTAVQDFTDTFMISDCSGASTETITVTQTTGGTVSPGTTIVTTGDNQSFTATADTCYTFSNWIVDGSPAGSANPYTFTNVTTDHTIEAVYTLTAGPYNITSSAGSNGSISPNGTTSVTCGNDQSYTITPDSGYTVQDVLVDGISVGAVTSYTFSNVMTSRTISVTFVVNTGCPDLFISEYIEGSGNNKCIEIYNNTGASVDLAAENYSILIYFNGSSTSGATINLTGTIADGDTHVVCNSFASSSFTALSDQLGNLVFSGDDAVALSHNSTNIDIIGQIGNDPGSQWGSGVQSTADNTLTRKCSLTCPSDNNGSDTFDPSVEWDGFAQDYISDLGQYSCVACTTPTNPTYLNSLNNCGEVQLEWDTPTCADEVLIVARASIQVSASPMGESTTYTANAVFGSGDDLDAPNGQYAVYRGTGTTTTITGLSEGVEYHFSIFSEAGGMWTSGLDTSATSVSSSTSGATDFDPGDLVFVGFDSYLGIDHTSDQEGDDMLALMSIEDIGPSTQFTIANLLYEWNAAADVSTGRWYNCGSSFTGIDPPYVTIQYNGCADIPKGTVICIGIDQFPAVIYGIKVNGVTVSVTSAPDFSGDFVILDNPSHSDDDSPGNMSTTNPDTMWLMQGTFSDAMTEADGPDADTSPDIYRTFTGDVLGGLQTKGSFQPFSSAGNSGGARVSRIHPDIECFFQETGPTSATAFYGYHSGLTTGTNYQILQSITNNADWVIASADFSNSDQDRNSLIDICNDNYKITGVTPLTDGQWLGRAGTGGDDWFNCRNWENFNVPNTSTNVVINSSSTRDCVIDYDSSNAIDFSYQGDCATLTISDYSLLVEDSNDVLHVVGNLTIDSSGSLDMDGSTATDGQLFIGGNWTNTIGDSAFDEGNSTVTFNGTGTQTITYGGPPVPPGPQETEVFGNLILDNDFDIDIVGNSDRALYANGDLTITATHTLTVRSGSYVHAGDQLINNNSTSGSFSLEDSASLIQVNDAATNVGNLNMERTVFMRQLDYVYWSSPISGFNVNSVSPGSPTNHIYRWGPTAANTGTGNGQGNWVYSYWRNHDSWCRLYH